MARPGDTFEVPATGETFTILETPEETGDRYRAHVLVRPSAKGPPLHVHPGVAENFRVVKGVLTYKVGGEQVDVPSSEGADVEAGTAHAFWNATNEPAEYEVDLVFGPPGPRPEADLVAFGQTVAKLIEQGRVSSRTGMPKLLQIAVLFDYYRDGMAFPGPMWLQRGLIRPLAAVGRARGYTAEA